MDLQVRDQIVLVTAASRGIGRGVTERLAREGALVVAAARTEGRETEQIGDGQIIPVTVDLSQPGSASALVDQVHDTYGRIDIIVANTPGPMIKPALQLTWEDWSGAHDLLLRPVVELLTRGGQLMTAAGSGSMVLMSSTWVRQPAPGGVLSAAYRSAQSSFVKSLATEVAPSGVRVNQVLVGATGTERTDRIVADKAAAHGTSREQEIDKMVREIPLGRIADVAEVADAIAFLASPLPGFATGTSLVIDGGAIRAAH